MGVVSGWGGGNWASASTAAFAEDDIFKGDGGRALCPAKKLARWPECWLGEVSDGAAGLPRIAAAKLWPTKRTVAPKREKTEGERGDALAGGSRGVECLEGVVDGDELDDSPAS